MSPKCPSCGNETIYNNKCMNCGHVMGAPASGGQGRATPPTSPPTAPAAPQGNRSLMPPNSQNNPILPPPAPGSGAIVPTGGQTGNRSLVPPSPMPPATSVGTASAGPALIDWHTILINGKPIKGGPPQQEGTIENLDGPHVAQTQPSVWRQIMASWGLGKISPWMAQGGYMIGRRDFHIWNCRLKLTPVYQAANNGTPSTVVVIMNKQPQITFQLGDTIAVWGKVDRRSGVLVVQRAYVYETNAWVVFKS